MARHVGIENETPDRTYFTIVPNIVDELDLTTHDRDLYRFFRKVAGDNGACWMSYRTIHEQTGISPAQISKSRKVLEENKLIRCESRKHAGASWPTWNIVIIDVWERNMQVCKAASQRRSDEAQKCSLSKQIELPDEKCLLGEQKCLPGKQIGLHSKQSRLQDGVQIRCKDINILQCEREKRVRGDEQSSPDNSTEKNAQEHAHSGEQGHARANTSENIPMSAFVTQSALDLDVTSSASDSAQSVLALEGKSSASVSMKVAPQSGACPPQSGATPPKKGGLPHMMPAAKSVGAMEREIVWQAWCGAAKVLNGGVTQESRDRKILNKLLGHYAQGAKSESEKFMRTTRKVYAVKDVVDCINAMVECGVHVTGAGLVATLIDDFIDGSKAWPDVYWQPKKQRDSRAITERRDELRRMSKEQDEIARGV